MLLHASREKLIRELFCAFFCIDVHYYSRVSASSICFFISFELLLLLACFRLTFVPLTSRCFVCRQFPAGRGDPKLDGRGNIMTVVGNDDSIFFIPCSNHQHFSKEAISQARAPDDRSLPSRGSIDILPFHRSTSVGEPESPVFICSKDRQCPRFPVNVECNHLRHHDDLIGHCYDDSVMDDVFYSCKKLGNRHREDSHSCDVRQSVHHAPDSIRTGTSPAKATLTTGLSKPGEVVTHPDNNDDSILQRFRGDGEAATVSPFGHRGRLSGTFPRQSTMKPGLMNGRTESQSPPLDDQCVSDISVIADDLSTEDLLRDMTQLSHRRRPSDSFATLPSGLQRCMEVRTGRRNRPQDDPIAAWRSTKSANLADSNSDDLTVSKSNESRGDVYESLRQCHRSPHSLPDFGHALLVPCSGRVCYQGEHSCELQNDAHELRHCHDWLSDKNPGLLDHLPCDSFTTSGLGSSSINTSQSTNRSVHLRSMPPQHITSLLSIRDESTSVDISAQSSREPTAHHSFTDERCGHHHVPTVNCPMSDEDRQPAALVEPRFGGLSPGTVHTLHPSPQDPSFYSDSASRLEKLRLEFRLFRRLCNPVSPTSADLQGTCQRGSHSLTGPMDSEML